MFIQFTTIVGLVACVAAKDLIIGGEGGSVIFQQNVTASPTIWQQVRNLTVNASDYEFISRVEVLDNRVDKYGEATIVEGSVGQKNVTIQLKSPAVFRGFDFLVKVYAKPEDGVQHPAVNQQHVQEPIHSHDIQTPNEQVAKELVTPASTSNTQEQNTQGEAQHPVVVGKVDEQQIRQNRDTQKPVTDEQHQKPHVVEQQQKKTELQADDDQLATTLDDIFGEHNSSVQKPAESVKPGQFLIDDVKVPVPREFIVPKPVEIVPSTTVKAVKEQTPVHTQQGADGQKVKELDEKAVPIPYAKHH